jgi:hypothetical protein
MGWIVLCERPDLKLWNDDTAQRGTLRGWERRHYGGAHRNGALRRARRHRTMRAADAAIATIGGRLTATRVRNRITHACAHRRRINQGRPLENRGQNQGNGEKAMVHARGSLLQRQRLTT